MDQFSSFRISQLRFRNLRLLQLIQECGSVRKAAERLHVTQPAASAMLREIEQALGLTLFVRSRSGMTPTPAVKTLLRRVQVIGNELSAIEAEAIALATRSRELFRVGVLPRSMQNIMPGVLARVVQQNKGVEISLTEATSDVLLDALARGELDCVVGRLTTREGRQSAGGNPFLLETLYEEGMCVVVAREHLLAKRKKLTLTDLSNCNWVLPPPGSVTRNLLVDEFLHAGLMPPSPVIQSSSFLSNLSLVEQGGLVTISPISAARKYQQFRGIKILNITLSMPLPPISLIWGQTRAMEGTLQIIRDELRIQVQ
ncbi:LysR family transcriptional regulator [Pusillimonas sp. ANT_WB101]|uniref:LysR family transcriptional regulator n=1 Tax=Pusillimonas sp. ANT_WB101 TaxID=2597356 RepID=UPI0011EF9AA1|nr:LysR family transcriptional regulator [Pusillimonas sp. ANT_WB101]KAA0890922.1 LysR family transcriptional regulator [Pusillimonas sp. ANT_WB101]